MREGCGGIAKVSNAGSSTDAFRSKGGGGGKMSQEKREKRLKNKTNKDGDGKIDVIPEMKRPERDFRSMACCTS